MTDAEKIVALLTEIRDRLPEPEGVNDERAEPTDITEEPPRGSQVTDRGGDVWERREKGWALWWPERSGWIADLYEGGAFDPWAVVRDQAPLHPTTDEDRKRVGLPVEEACDCGSRPEEIGGAAHRIGCPEPAPADEDDEALARVLREVMADDWTATDLAHAAREHIGHEVQMGNARLLADMRDRAEKAGAERDEWKDHAEKVETDRSRIVVERDEWKAKHAALRADVEMVAGGISNHYGRGLVRDVLDRDAEREPQS